MRPQLVVMLKLPRPGRVKTRLGRDIGMVGAAWWFRHQVARVLRRLEDPRWDLILAVAPDHEGMAARIWPAHLPRIPQGPGDLGDRMARVMRTRPPGPVCIIGGDIPGVDRPYIARAFARLGDHDAVFGPAPDGGYWLVGLKRVGAVPSGLFKNVRWSSDHALSDSMATLRDSRIALIDTLQDVDTAADLEG
ncbi:TIGR04282 family arsenosugar biosynthesis glycosyltransferase [Roseovarius sp. 2305UL8-3]|uniref:TIGR04282 family arsenosugar biosynthesis glycosyltransferase n=1 Tax=Roseovarius conchicola TaxID=3121636 RepID=UPI003528C7E8